MRTVREDCSFQLGVSRCRSRRPTLQVVLLNAKKQVELNDNIPPLLDFSRDIGDDSDTSEMEDDERGVSNPSTQDTEVVVASTPHVAATVVA